MVASAISAGIFNDLGSGSNVDVCIIEKDKTEMLRNFETPVRLHPSLLPSIPLARARRLDELTDRLLPLFLPASTTSSSPSSPLSLNFRSRGPLSALSQPHQNERPTKDLSYKFARGTTSWVKQDVRKFVVAEERRTHGNAGLEGGEVPPPVGGEAAMEVDVGA